MLDDVKTAALDLGGSLLDEGQSFDLDDGVRHDAHKEPDPFADIEYEGLESDGASEASALLLGFRKRAKDEEKRFREATDSEYWFAVCFRNREQKEAFLKALEWSKYGDKYLDGLRLARDRHIELPPDELRPRGEKQDRKLVDLGIIHDLDGGE